MDALVVIPPNDRGLLASLFATHDNFRTMIDCVLAGHLGVAVADDTAAPQVARLRIGVYEFFAGNALSEAARGAVRSVSRPCEIVLPHAGSAWKELVTSIWSGSLAPHETVVFDADKITGERLRSLAHAPVGFRIAPLSVELAAQLGPELFPNRIGNFASVDDFVTRGFGTCAVHEETIACACSTYAITDTRVELAIATRLEHRRRGLALPVAAGAVLEALRRSLRPVWNAASYPSARIAESLGFVPVGVFETLELEA